MFALTPAAVVFLVVFFTIAAAAAVIAAAALTWFFVSNHRVRVARSESIPTYYRSLTLAR